MNIKGLAVGIFCKRCKAPVEVKSTERLREEFSVQCPKCGHRDIYQIREIKPLQK